MSENIFSNFYNKVLSFFQKDRLQDGESAKDAATNRLKLVLMQDRSNLDGATMQKMREQLIAVISRYVEIDQEALDLNLEADGDEIALMLNIPVIRARTREEIEELEKQEQESLKAVEAEEEQTEESEESSVEEENNSEEEEENSDEENDESGETQDSENNDDTQDESEDLKEDETSQEEQSEEICEENTEDKKSKKKK